MQVLAVSPYIAAVCGHVRGHRDGALAVPPESVWLSSSAKSMVTVGRGGVPPYSPTHAALRNAVGRWRPGQPPCTAWQTSCGLLAAPAMHKRG